MYGFAEGAFVYCLVQCASDMDARSRFLEALGEDGYEVVDTESIEIFSEQDWGDEQAEFDKLAKKAETTGQVVYGEFYAFDHDDDVDDC